MGVYPLFYGTTGTVRHGGGQVNVKMRWRATRAFRVHIPGVQKSSTPNENVFTL
jgi:hypothetical protein